MTMHGIFQAPFFTISESMTAMVVGVSIRLRGEGRVNTALP
jgi:hypothetical protein